MKKAQILMCLSVAVLLALAAGCGKTETAAPPAQETDKATRVAKSEPTQTAEKLVSQTSSAVATTTDTARNNVDAAVTPMKQTAPEAVDATNQAVDKTQGAASETKATLEGLSRDQVVKGLQDALAKGLQQAVARLGHEGGFLTNLQVKIPMPEQLQTVEKALRAMAQGKLADDFVTTMNRAAERAVPEAAGVFADALKQMTIEDAKSILSGPNTAATQYFQKTTQTNLYAMFYPTVQKATAQTGVTAAYKNLMERAHVGQSLGSIGSALGGSPRGKESLDIDAYVTNKALDGLFKMVAEEERQIRQNPAARTTDLLQKVFGAKTSN